MPYKGERPLLRRKVVGLSHEILTYLWQIGSWILGKDNPGAAVPEDEPLRADGALPSSSYHSPGPHRAQGGRAVSADPPVLLAFPESFYFKCFFLEKR